MVDERETVVFGFGVDAVVGFDVFRDVNGILGIVHVLFAEDLHCLL